MRARCFHYWTSRLALAAALLLVLAPVGTRLLAATTPHAGMEHGPGTVQATSVEHVRHTPLPAHPDRATHPDCAYCPLLGSLDQLAPQTPSLAPVSSAASPTAAATIPPRNWRHPNGLGSRGPPTALQPHPPT